MEAVFFALGALVFGGGVYIGYRLARPDAPSLSLPGKVHGYFPTQEELDDASDQS